MYKYTIPFLVSLLMALTAWNSQAQTIAMAIRTVATRPAAVAEKHSFYTNPLVLNGKSLDYTFFTTSSRGTLAVVAGNPDSKEATKIPFRVYLRRNGMNILNGTSSCNREVYEADLAAVLSKSQHGDELIIEPVNKIDEEARRVIHLKSTHWFFWIKPGC
ncbi:hypothetical protein GCM10028805_55790 [Spirosoma harenae]